MIELGKPKWFRESPRCPECNALIDGASSVGGDYEPKAGDATLCLYCGRWLIFVVTDEMVSFRFATPDEVSTIREMDEARAAEAGLLNAWGEGGELLRHDSNQ